MAKKLISLLVVFMMAFGLAVSAAFTDVENHKYEDEINLLYSFGIVEGKEANEYKPEDTLTRAEMVTIVLRLLNVSGSAASAFTDVAADHWANLNIGTAYNMGIINGISETEFAPEEAVTYPQAVKMIMVALGYKVPAETAGGYPTGYLTYASREGVLDGTENNGNAITRGTMAKLVANALEVPLFTYVSYGSNPELSQSPTDTILNTYLKIEKMEGTVGATYMTDVTAGSTSEGQILLDGEALNVGVSGAENYLGHKVTVYAQLDDADEYTILCIEDKAVTDTVIVDAADIKTKSTTAVLYYEAEGKERKATISGSATWIVNGQEVAADNALLNIETGNIKLVGQGSTYNTVIIESYKNFIVDSVRKEDKKVIFKEGTEGMSSLVIDYDVLDKKIEFLNADGTQASLDTLLEWDVLSIAESANKDIIRIIRSDKQAMGKVEEIVTRAGKTELRIGEEFYKVAANLTRSTEFEVPALGMEASFKLDFTGKIAAHDTESFRDYKYAWLVNFSKSQGLGAEYEVMMFTEDGEMKIFGVAKNFILNERKRDSLDIADAPELYSGAEPKSQLVRFEANAEDELTDMAVAETIDSSMPTEERVSKFTALPSSNADGSATLYGSPLNIYEFKYLLQDRTKIFSVPATYTKDSDYKLINPSTMFHMDKLPNVTYYDILEDSGISAMTSVGVSATIENIGIITSVGLGISNEGANVVKLTVEGNKGVSKIALEEDQDVLMKELTSNVKMDDVDGLVDKNKETQVGADGNLKLTIPATSLKSGDIIWYGNENSEGITANVRIVARKDALRYARWSYSSGDYHGVGKGSDYELYVYTVGKVKATSDYAVAVETRTQQYVNYLWDWFTEEKPLVLKDVPFVAEYDAAEDKLSIISPSEIKEGDTLFTWRSNLQERIMIVYKNLGYEVDEAQNY